MQLSDQSGRGREVKSKMIKLTPNNQLPLFQCCLAQTHRFKHTLTNAHSRTHQHAHIPSSTVQYMQMHNTHSLMVNKLICSSQQPSICRHSVEAAVYSNWTSQSDHVAELMFEVCCLGHMMLLWEAGGAGGSDRNVSVGHWKLHQRFNYTLFTKSCFCII